MIILHRRDRLGNILFQYCFARVLAHRFAYRLYAMPIPWFPGTLDFIDGEEVLGPLATWHGQWPFDRFVSRPIRRGELFAPPGARLSLAGWFQRFDLIAEYRETIREDWLRLDTSLPRRSSRDFAICLRLGDYTSWGGKRNADPNADTLANSILREEEVRQIAAQVSYERLYLVTDQPRHPMIEALRDLRAEIISGSPIDDFRFIHSFQKVAISQSTFHWWATFLGAAREIYFPPLERGIWSRPQPALSAGDPGHYGIDLRVDETRYIYNWAE